MGSRRWKRGAQAAAAFALLGSAIAPSQLAASDGFSSSMQAVCYTEDCSIVQYNLNLIPAAYVSFMTWTVEGSARESGVAFASSLGSIIETDVGAWSVVWLSSGEIQLSSGGEPTLTPSWFRLAMTGVSDASQLNTGEAVAYSGSAFESYDSETDTYSGSFNFNGHVSVPEPGSMLLMMTGLLGVGGAGVFNRRRRLSQQLPA